MMKLKVVKFFFIVAIVALVTVTAALADDGKLVRKSMSHEGQPSEGPLGEAEHAFIKMMQFYVPAQAANGTSAPVDYYDVDETLVETRDHAKPLIGVYLFGPVEGIDGVGFVGHGKRDAFGAVSLDDGNTWKNTNLSESAGETSSDVIRTDIPLFSDTGGAYPGDAVNIFHAVASNKVLVAWPSRFCSQGQPNYYLSSTNASDDQLARRDAIATYLGINLDTASPDDLYLIDMYGVSGNQGSVNYAEDKFDQNKPVGMVPYNCLWTARGVLVNGDDPRTAEDTETSYMRWFKAERLTSGRRDVNRIETVCVAGAGCAITWQEDPEGLRPGQGEGPGEGWSGAIANRQTDIWYSYIPWEHFDVVQDPSDGTGATSMTFEDYTTAAIGDITQKPKPYVPFAMPMRMTDNAKCNVEQPQPYCNGSAISANFPDLPVPMDYGLKDLCADTIEIATGKSGEIKPVCVTENGLPLLGSTASTRPRLGLYGYESDGAIASPEEAEFDGAFVVVVAEEDKGLGAFGFTDDYEPNATACDPEDDEGCVPFDEGKNIWYHSFSMSLTDTLRDDPLDGLLHNLASHGNMLNQPEVAWEKGEFYPARSTEDMWDFDEYNYDIYNTEIARRGSLLAQDIAKAEASSSDLTALPAWKQGAMNQGGPSDVMTRRIVGNFCSIEVDADQPVIEEATYLMPQEQLYIRYIKADDIAKTAVVIRDAVSQEILDTIAGPKPDHFGYIGTDVFKDKPLPCAIQAADDDGSLEWGPWIPVEYPEGIECANPLPPGCTYVPSTIEAANAVNATRATKATKATAEAAAAAAAAIVENPYAFRNMVCENWAYEDGSNPHYPEGVCLDSAINLSGSVPDTCIDSSSENGDAVLCPQVDLVQGTTFGVGDTNPILQGNDVEPNTTKVLSWHQCPAGFTTVKSSDGTEIYTCDNDLRTDDSTLADQSWYNPLDVAKGHRGFLDGDFVMILYAWSPNWRLNTVGHDRYELYIRRSFNGAQTWTTTPASFNASDGLSYSGEGTVSCETFRSKGSQLQGEESEPRICNSYDAGAAEQARNITQLKSMKTTTLDPRYATTGAPRGTSITADPFDTGYAFTDEDTRDPSRYFIVYETGDNTTTKDGEPEPLDLFYSRAVMFGDHYQVWAEEDDLSLCYPSNPHDNDVFEELIDSGFCNEFDQLDQGTPGLEASESSLTANPGGEFLYGAWSQIAHEASNAYEIGESDAMARRVWWLDGYISATDAWVFGQGTGDGEPANP